MPSPSKSKKAGAVLPLAVAASHAASRANAPPPWPRNIVTPPASVPIARSSFPS